MRVTVIGAGVVGLTIANRLADDGHDVRILTSDLPKETTSAVAAALWFPYRAYPEAEVTRWAGVTYRALASLADVEGTGVRMRSGRELFRQPTADPWWKAAVPNLERVTDLPHGYQDGFRLTVPAVDMSMHLDWLAERLAERDISIKLRTLDSLDEAPGDVVVNCTGLGARTLVHDKTMTPVRGQVVIVEQFGLDEWTLDDAEEAEGRLTYIVPRENTVILGGTAEEGGEDTTPQPDIAGRILARCAKLVPEIANARIVGHRVGLRPGRPAVRLEKDTIEGGRTVIHCYGHGGSGVTLAQGCAHDVAAVVSGL